MPSPKSQPHVHTGSNYRPHISNRGDLGKSNMMSVEINRSAIKTFFFPKAQDLNRVFQFHKVSKTEISLNAKQNGICQGRYSGMRHSDAV